MDNPPSGKSYMQSTIGSHPGSAAIVVAVLVVLILVLSYALVHYKGKCKKGFEGLATDGAAAGGSADSGAPAPFPQVGPRAACGVGWDPAASAEAQALASAGSLQHDSYGEGGLQTAIDGAYDSSAGLDDAQLSALMQDGGAM